MEVNMKRYTALTILIVTALSFWSCTESVQPDTHSDTWMNQNSVDFHGQMLATRGWEGLESCKTCHGTFLDGGHSGVSCTMCHAGGASGHPGTIDHLRSGTDDFHGAGMDPNGSEDQAETCWQCHSLNSDGPVAMGCHQCHGAENPIF